MEIPPITRAAYELGVALEISRRRIAVRYGLSSLAVGAVLHLRMNDAVAPTALAVRFSLTRKKISALLDALESHALIERLPHPTDRRSRLIVLTDSGRRVTDEFIADFGERVHRASVDIRTARKSRK